MRPGARTQVGPPLRWLTSEPGLGFGAWAVGGAGWGPPAAETDRLVMGAAHKTLPVHGVQFHPESIASEHGHLILKNFLELAAAWNQATGRRDKTH